MTYRLALGALALTMLISFAASPALATLIGQQLTVQLISPNDGNLSLSDSVLASGGGDILPADGSAIGAVMLSTEFIDLGTGGGDQIVIGLEEGLASGLTGYGNGARYVVSGLYVGLDLIISSVSVTTSNISGVSYSFDQHSVTVFIDDLVIGEIAGIDSGSITLDLTTAVVPEAGTATLLLLGLSGLGLHSRRGRG